MKKFTKKTNLLATAAVLAAAQALVAGQALAQSSVTISGIVDTYAGSTQLSGTPRQTRVESGGLSASQLTFSGVEDLGGSLKAEFGLSMFLRADTGANGRSDTDPLFARLAFVGL